MAAGRLGWRKVSVESRSSGEAPQRSSCWRIGKKWSWWRAQEGARGSQAAGKVETSCRRWRLRGDCSGKSRSWGGRMSSEASYWASPECAWRRVDVATWGWQQLLKRPHAVKDLRRQDFRWLVWMSCRGAERVRKSTITGRLGEHVGLTLQASI